MEDDGLDDAFGGTTGDCRWTAGCSSPPSTQGFGRRSTRSAASPVAGRAQLHRIVRPALFDDTGKLACAIVDARSSGAPSARTAARLSLDGYDDWYHGARTKATITRSDNPLPELASPSPSPASTLPTVPALVSRIARPREVGSYARVRARDSWAR